MGEEKREEKEPDEGEGEGKEDAHGDDGAKLNDEAEEDVDARVKE